MLTRDRVTIASRIMLPTYPVFAGIIGVVYMLDPGGRLPADRIFPLLPADVWGAGFVIVAVMQVLALLSGRRGLYIAALAPMAVWCAAWSVALAHHALTGTATYSGFAFPAIVATACIASMASLLAQEQ